MKGLKYYRISALTLFCFLAIDASAQEDVAVDAVSAGNPILPGYFADPTIKKFGDTYYIYSTTDNEMLASGAPTVWYSKDLKNWFNYIMDIPPFTSKPITNFWAPDIIEGSDGQYYLYFGNCELGCNIYGYVSDSPIGPWKKLFENDDAVIPSGYPIKNFPSLDAQFFEDTDGKIYAYWGTWVHYNNGYAIGELDRSTMRHVSKARNIPLAQTPEPFEAPYLMKKGDKYILMYSGASCHDESYHVRYAYADSPYGPFIPGANNPILSTNENQTTHGPGHHSVLEDGNDFYIVYHKHDYPFTAGGMARQVCLDKMTFMNDSTIAKVIPTSRGVSFDIPSLIPDPISIIGGVRASSAYTLLDDSLRYEYKSSYATDDNFATMWKAADNSFPQSLILDLGKTTSVNRILTSFEFATHYYQYRWEYSNDGEEWSIGADRTENHTAGSPMIDDVDVEARYLKLTITGHQKAGVYAAVWDIKVFSDRFDLPITVMNKPIDELPGCRSHGSLLLELNARHIDDNSLNTSIINVGSIGGRFRVEGDVSIDIDHEGVKSFQFNSGSLILDEPVPCQLAWNGAFTVETWVKNPEVSDKDECIFSWCDRHENYLANSYTALFYNSGRYGAAAHMHGAFDMKYKEVPSSDEWHHIVLTFDGVREKIYVDGRLDNAQNMMLASQISNAKIRIGSSDAGEYFTGNIASLRMYDYALTQEDILLLMDESDPR